MIITGTGKMGQAMLSPLITQNLQSPSSMTVYDVSDAALRKVEELYPGVKASRNISDAIADSNLIVYGVKPQNVSIVSYYSNDFSYKHGILIILRHVPHLGA